MAPALLALILAPPIDPADLFQKVAARYAALDSFLLEVHERRLPLDVLPVQDPVRKRLAAAPGDRFFLEIQTAIRFYITSDGDTVRSGQTTPGLTSRNNSAKPPTARSKTRSKPTSAASLSCPASPPSPVISAPTA